MTELCITNSTRQTVLFQVRWPGDHSGKVWERGIPRGGRLIITERDIGAGPDAKWKVIQKHLDNMGARDAAELHGANLDDFKGVSYRWDHEVSIEEVEKGHEIVLDNVSRISAEEAMKAAAGAHIAINGETGAVKTSTVEVIEDFDRVKGPTDQNLKFRVEVDKNAPIEKPKLRRK